MKKIALLFSILCVGQLYGMVPDYMNVLPVDMKKLVILTLAQSNTIEEAVNAIRSLTQTDKEFNVLVNNPIMTRALIRILAEKFNAPSEYIAKKLSMQASKQYINLYNHLRAALWQKNFTLAENLIKAGADIDFQTADVYPMLCAPTNIINLLNMLNIARSKQANIEYAKQTLLILQGQSSLDEDNIKGHQQILESNQMYLQEFIPHIRIMLQENKDIFKDDEQFNYFITKIDKENFQEAFVIIEPKTIMSHNPTNYLYQIEETPDECIVGANFSFVMYAIAANQPVLLEWLLKHKANLNLTMGTGDTALLMAIHLGKKDMIELLVKNGANVNQQKILKVNEEVHKKIDEFGVVGLGGNIDQTHMMYTLLDDDTLALIFKNGLAMSGNTPLIDLLYSGHFNEQELYDLISLLLNNGANPNTQNDNGETPLIILTFTEGEGIANIMKLLLEHGANPAIKDNEGMTALDHMKSEQAETDPERDEKIQMLEEAMKKQQK